MATTNGTNGRNGSWRKYFKLADTNQMGQLSPISGKNNFGLPGYNRSGSDFESGTRNEFAFRNYASRLPEVYSGHPNRLERYNQYENMDCDSEVNACLDIIAEFSTQANGDNGTPFDIDFGESPTDHEIEIIKKQLQQWTKLNKLDQRIFKLFRNAIKYGDQVFVRDPETFEMYWIDMIKVARIIVNESEGKRPEQYIIRDINPNFQNMSMAAKTTSDYYVSRSTGSVTTGGNYNAPNGGGGGGGGGGTGNSRFTQAMNESCIDAKHVVHLSLNEGLDYFWPFGQSILENIYKVYKQKELLEDSVLIYRVQRAPERRLFKIDVGNMPSHMAMAFVERVKNEMHQRRIPTVTGGGNNMMDASYNPLCLDLSTKIPLLDGRTLTLQEIIEEFNNGKENWAYSCNPETGKVLPGVINWAGVTRKNAEVIKITLDNGKELICTPDHKIPVFGKGFVEAKDLLETDSLIAFNTQLRKISNNGNEYQEVWDHESKKWVWTHRMVGEFFRNIQKHQEFTYLDEFRDFEKAVIHHKDHNRFNNDPRNLVYMNKKDHILYHASQKKEFWENMTEEYRGTMLSKISQTTRDNWEKMDEHTKLTALYNIRKAQQKAVHMRKTDPTVQAQYKINSGNAHRKNIAENPARYELLCKNLENRVKFSNQSLNMPFEILQEVVTIVKSGITDKKEVMKCCEQNQKIMSILKECNSTLPDGVTQNKIDTTQFGNKKMDRLLATNNYKNWKTFVKEISNFNHNIVKIERVESRDVGTITIDGTEKWNKFHTFAIDSGIFVKNSINEDYFFPQTSDGRGSSVEVLPGGQNLGEIDDLKYFNNKMARGLRVPSSYLPTGPDDSAATTNDGKVGTALIQEFRFNKYCERLQKLIMQKLDDEFKMFLHWRGFVIDSSIFTLRLTQPQNFASYRQSELDTARVSTFTAIEPLPYLSKRFILKRYLGLTEEEILENETLWKEERDLSEVLNVSGQDLRSVGVTPAGMDADMDMGDDLANTGVGTADVDAGAGPAAGPQTAPGAGSVGSPAGNTAGA